MRYSRVRVLAALVMADVIAACTIVGVARAGTDSEVPTALHGSVETQALTAGNGALALFVDPGTAYAYSTMDRDDYGGGSLSYTMTARGANLNLGTIAYAVVWAAPDCSQDGNFGCIASGGMGTPNTGLHEAAGFPLYAEALYPPPPAEDGPSRERVYKCIVSKDAPGAKPTDGAAQDVCKSSDSVPFTSWAEAPGDELRSTGFSRVAGFTTPVVSVGTSESHSDVRYVGNGKLRSKGSSAIEDIDILAGAIHIESSKATASVVSGIDGAPERVADCTLSGLAINGEKTSINDISNPDVQKQLDAIAEATGYKVQIIPPAPVVLEQREGGKQVASCRGVQVFLTDLHEGSPVPACAPPIDPSVPECVPAAGNRIELTFGSISVQQSVNDLAGALDLGGGGLVGELTSAVAGGDISGSTPPADLAPAASPSTPLQAPAANDSGAPAAPSPGDTTLTGRLASSIGGRNLGAIGALTAAATAALLGGILLLIGVVTALGNGGRFRFPGLGP